MDELISRQAAIDAIGERPFACIESAYDHEYEHGLQNQWERDMDAIKILPSAQPEIIKCKDCKHREVENGFCEGRGWPMQLVLDDGFCDKGERRTDG